MYNRDKIINTMQEIYDESKVIGPYVLVGQPRRDLNETAAQNFDGYDGLHVDMLGFSHGFANIGGEKVDVARNYIMEQAIESGAKYLFFVGEDTVVPYHAFKTLLKTAEANPNAVVTGVYYIKCSDAMIMVREKDWITIPNVDPGQLIDAWQTGMDVMLIPIDILKQMKAADSELPFCCIGNNIEGPKGVIPFIGEDNFFVHRLHKMGFKLLVNTDVQCLHMDLATGNYTAHPDVKLEEYYTNIPIGRPLTMEDKAYIDKRWIDRLPEGTGAKANKVDKIQEVIDAGLPLKFNMGSGRDQLEGYLGVDKYTKESDIKVDLLEAEFSENCADEILASHVLEHLPQHRVPEVLSKWNRTLKPGGKLVIEVPNLEALCQDFVNGTDEERYMISICIYGAAVTNPTPEQEKYGTESPHLWGYYPKVMKDLLEGTGFKDVKILPNQGLHIGKNFRAEATK